MSALFKEQEGNDFRDITMNNREGGSKMMEKSPAQNQIIWGLVNHKKGVWIFILSIRRPLKDFRKEGSSQNLTYSKTSLGLEGREWTLERTSGRTVERQSVQHR